MLTQAPTRALGPSIPFFTIGLTTYKRPTLLAKAIQSVLAQTYEDYEFIIVDDASSDDTEYIVKRFENPTLQYIRQPTNQGVGPARNEVIRRAQGKFIVFIDDDDRFPPDFLSNAYRALRDLPASVGFAVSAQRIFQKTGEEEIFLKENNYGYTSTVVKPGRDFLQRPWGGTSGLIVRTCAAREINGFSTERLPVEDTLFMVQLSTKWDFAILPQVQMLVYSIDGDQMTKNNAKIGAGFERIGDFEDIRTFPKTRLRFYRKSARQYYAADQRENGRRSLAKALRIAPLSYRTWCLFILLEFNKRLPHNIRRRFLGDYRNGFHSEDGA
jgi:glycosyltransferase involved in cell wall biosynthesis